MPKTEKEIISKIHAEAKTWMTPKTELRKVLPKVYAIGAMFQCLSDDEQETLRAIAPTLINGSLTGYLAAEHMGKLPQEVAKIEETYFPS